jgi:hypothetical protein
VVASVGHQVLIFQMYLSTNLDFSARYLLGADPYFRCLPDQISPGVWVYPYTKESCDLYGITGYGRQLIASSFLDNVIPVSCLE